MRKTLGNCEVELSYFELNQGCRVNLRAIEPFMLFAQYGDDLINLKKALEKVCDEWVEELGKSIHTNFSLPTWSFTQDEISLIREYVF